MKPALIVASVMAFAGFCINAALVVCKRQQGAVIDAEDTAYQAVAFLIAAVVLALLAWSWQ